MANVLVEQVKNKEKLIRYLAAFTIYKILIEYVYVVAVSYWYDYLGFIYSPSISKCVLSYAIFWALICVLDRTVSINGILVNSFFSVCIVPMLSFYWLADKNTLFLMYDVLFFIILNSVAKKKEKKLVVTFGRQFQKYELILNILLFVYVLLCAYLGLKRGGIDARAFSFSSIYNMRSESTGIGGIESYFVEWCTKSIFPILLTYYLYIKHYFKAAIVLVCQVFMYLCFGFKAYILAAIMTLFVYFVTRNSVKKKHESNIRTLIIFILGLIPCTLSKVGGILGAVGFSLNNVFAMRMLYEPARIQNGYFDYFSVNNKLYFSEGLIGKLFGLDYPYNEAIGFVITRHLNGLDAVSNSNTGIIADSYSQLGILGIFFIAILCGLLVLLIKKVCIYTPSYCISAMFFYPVIMWNDNPLLTNLLTNGWFLDIILIILIEGALRNRASRSIKMEENNYVTI